MLRTILSKRSDMHIEIPESFDDVGHLGIGNLYQRQQQVFLRRDAASLRLRAPRRAVECQTRKRRYLALACEDRYCLSASFFVARFAGLLRERAGLYGRSAAPT